MIANYPYFGLPNYMRYMNMGMPMTQVSPMRPNFYTQGSSFRKQPNNKYQERNYSSNIPQNNNISKDNTRTNSQTKENLNTHNEKHSKSDNCSSQNFQDSSPMFNLLGLNIYFDDILIICVLFFLYNEGVNDPYLFLTLVLLLMS